MPILNIVVLLIYLLFYPLTASSTTERHYAAVIKFSNSQEAERTVYAAYLQVFKMIEGLDLLTKSAIKASNDALSPTERLKLNEQFQSDKHKLDFLDKSFSIKALVNNESIIEIRDDGKENHLRFYIPAMFINDLHLEYNNLKTIQNAKNAVLNLKEVINKINNILPRNKELTTLQPFLNTPTIPYEEYEKTNILSFETTDDSQKILDSLVTLNTQMSAPVKTCLNLAEEVAAGTHTEEEMNALDIEFQYKVSEFLINDSNNLGFGNFKLFNDNKLTFYMDGQALEYYFGALDEGMSKLDSDTILTTNEARKTIDDLMSIHRWASKWIINRTAVFRG